MRWLVAWIVLLAVCWPLRAGAAEAPPLTPLEAQVQRIATELRCLVCQNQTIADSNAELAQDLKRQVRTLLQQGKSEAEVLDYMTTRYGDFVLYRPPVKGSTWLLWFGPAVLLVGAAGVLIMILRRRSRLPPEAFEPDAEPEAVDDKVAR